MIALQEVDIFSLVEEWKEKAQRATQLKYEAKRAFAEAYAESGGRSEGARSNDGHLASNDLDLRAEQAKHEAKAAEFLLQFALTEKPNH